MKNKFIVISKGKRYNGWYYFGNHESALRRYRMECKPGRVVLLSSKNRNISVYNDGVYNTRSGSKYSYLDPGVTL